MSSSGIYTAPHHRRRLHHSHRCENLKSYMNKVDSEKSSSHIHYCYQAGWYSCTLAILTVVYIVFLSLSRYMLG
jgi:hypothetical protein